MSAAIRVDGESSQLFQKQSAKRWRRQIAATFVALKNERLGPWGHATPNGAQNLSKNSSRIAKSIEMYEFTFETKEIEFNLKTEMRTKYVYNSIHRLQGCGNMKELFLSLVFHDLRYKEKFSNRMRDPDTVN